MLQGGHFAIILAFIKLPFVIKIYVLSIFGWPFYTGCTVIVIFCYFSIFVAFILEAFILEYSLQKTGKLESVVESKIKGLGLGIGQ